jgi:hypothetical protein
VKTIWLVGEGQYSSAEYLCGFTDKALADEYIERLNRARYAWEMANWTDYGAVRAGSYEAWLTSSTRAFWIEELQLWDVVPVVTEETTWCLDLTETG